MYSPGQFLVVGKTNYVMNPISPDKNESQVFRSASEVFVAQLRNKGLFSLAMPARIFEAAGIPRQSSCKLNLA